jgi:hypothetical protein
LTILLLLLILAPVLLIAAKHFLRGVKLPERRGPEFPFPVLGYNGKYREKPTFRPVDYALTPRDKRFDWY